VARYDAIRAIDQSGIDKSELLNAGGDLLDLPGRMRAGIFEARFELARVLISDGQRPHSAPQSLASMEIVQLTNRESKILGISPFLLLGFPIPRHVFPIIF
jgi:hypothetical protein